MASDDAHDLLRVIEDMVHDQRDDIVERNELKQQMEVREGWGEMLFEEAERELLRTGAVVQTLDGERLQVDRFEI